MKEYRRAWPVRPAAGNNLANCSKVVIGPEQTRPRPGWWHMQRAFLAILASATILLIGAASLLVYGTSPTATLLKPPPAAMVQTAVREPANANQPLVTDGTSR